MFEEQLPEYPCPKCNGNKYQWVRSFTFPRNQNFYSQPITSDDVYRRVRTIVDKNNIREDVYKTCSLCQGKGLLEEDEYIYQL